MFHRVRKHLTPATVLALTALIFAITGGAFAASGGGSHATLTASAAKAKAKVKTGPRGPAGKNGAPGAIGPAGPAGPAGPGGAGGPTGTGTPGAPGKDGEPGKAGESVTIAPAGGKCLEGGTKFSNATGEGTACNGEPGAKGETGSPWTAGGSLPSGSTETGTWSVRLPSELEGATAKQGNPVTSISFTVPLEAPLGETAVHYVTTEEQTKKTGPAGCSGVVEKPTAARGSFCLYEGLHEEPAGAKEPVRVDRIAPPASASTAGTGTTGAVVHVIYEGSLSEAVELYGTWAVTAP